MTSQYVSLLWRFCVVRHLRRQFGKTEFCRMQSSRASEYSRVWYALQNLKSIVLLNFGILSTVFLRWSKAGLQRTHDVRRPATKTSDRTFPVFLRRLIGASEQFVGDKAEISAFFWQRYESKRAKNTLPDESTFSAAPLKFSVIVGMTAGPQIEFDLPT